MSQFIERGDTLNQPTKHSNATNQSHGTTFKERQQHYQPFSPNPESSPQQARNHLDHLHEQVEKAQVTVRNENQPVNERRLGKAVQKVKYELGQRLQEGEQDTTALKNAIQVTRRHYKEKSMINNTRIDKQRYVDALESALVSQAESPQTDKGKSYDIKESQKIDLSKEFRQIGGNTSLKEAKIICLGNNHVDTEHTKLNAQLIDIVADEGDIILVEGLPAYTEHTPQSYAQTELISKKVIMFGWENDELYKQALEIAKRRTNIYNTIDKGNLGIKEYNDLIHESTENSNKLHSVHIERHKTLAKVIDHTRKRFPENKIFVLAGTNHFTKDTSFINRLDAYPYIALEPTHTLSDIEITKRMQQYYHTSVKT
jgi:hypothetical protein